jgi:hypothetical protein
MTKMKEENDKLSIKSLSQKEPGADDLRNSHLCSRKR